MSRRVREFPRWRALAALSVLLGGMRALPACDTPPAPGGDCYALTVAVASDHACMLLGPPTTYCGNGTDAGADGGSLQGCYLVSREMRCWGSGGLGRAGVASATSPARVDFGTTAGGEAPRILAMAVGTNRTCALLDGGRLRCWSGQESAASARDEDLPPVTQMSMGDEHLCVLLADRTVRCKGSNRDGQLGTTAVADASMRFVPVEGLSDVKQIEAGQRFTCALATWGGVHCWGRLGAVAAPTPQRIAGLPREATVDCQKVTPRPGSNDPNLRCTENLTRAITQFSVGGRHACGVDTRGDVWCWGDNEARQLGPATAAPASLSAVRVEMDPTGRNRFPARYVAAGDTHTCALLEAGPGRVYCWGNNRVGQLGQRGWESEPGFPFPIPVTTHVSSTEQFPSYSILGNISGDFLDSGGAYTCALSGGVQQLAAGGRVRCWGRLAGFAPTPVADTVLQCCLPTTAEPSGVCPNTQSDPRNCGRAGNVCAAGQVCTNGTCGCAAGQTMVGTTCVDVQTDARNCGRAGNACALANVATQRCQGGQCAVGACAAGFADCDGMAANGCEVNTATDASHCGACGTRCTGPNGTSTCAMGACSPLACSAGFSDCDRNPANGCEAALASDANNCGRCGNRCVGMNSMGACAMGACGALTCNAGFEDCNNDPTDGCETNTTTTSSCRSRPTALPAGSRALRHAVNIVGAGAEADRIGPYLEDDTGEISSDPLVERFYSHFGDDYDFLVVVSDRRVSDSVYGSCAPVRRNIPGTGTLNASPSGRVLAASPRRLKAFIAINQTDAMSLPPLLQEVAHYWGVDLPGALFPEAPITGHWGAASVRGQMGGFDGASARCVNADGSVGGALSTCMRSTSVTIDTPRTARSAECAATGAGTLGWSQVTPPNGDVIPYDPLELYLMGLVDRAGAGGPWYVLDSPRPMGGTRWSGSALRRVTMDDIIASRRSPSGPPIGVRTPTPESERSFRMAVVIFSATPVSDAFLNNVERWAAIHGNDPVTPPAPCFYSFERATGGRATMSTALGPTRRPLP